MSKQDWNWLQFAFGFAIGTGANFLALNLWALSLPAHIAKVAVVAVTCGLLAGRFGDSAWHWVVQLLRWNP